jgi:hypothetical protein
LVVQLTSVEPILFWSDWLSPWEWASSDWAGLTFVVLVLAAFVAWRQVKEAQRLRQEQARPFVVIDFHPWATIIELTIKNVGATLARDVMFAFDPPLATTHDKTSGRGNLMDLSLFKNGIPAFAPGKEITLFFDTFPARLEHGLPLAYEVVVSYRDPAGHEYREPTKLDLEMYVGTGGITRHDIHDVHKRLDEISKTLKRWTHPDGLKILTREDRKLYREDLEAREAAREKQAPPSDEDERPGSLS